MNEFKSGIHLFLFHESGNKSRHLYKVLILFTFIAENELVINPKEFPDVGIGDILEIYHPDEENRWGAKVIAWITYDDAQ